MLAISLMQLDNSAKWNHLAGEYCTSVFGQNTEDVSFIPNVYLFACKLSKFTLE